MGLFDKKYCDVCGEKIGLLGNRKLDDGNLCKKCAAKLSPWFEERRHSTVAAIKEQLQYREENRERVRRFNVTRQFEAPSGRCLFIDDTAGCFAIANRLDEETNPDIVPLSAVLSARMDIDEDRDEIRYKDEDGEMKSYYPPRYDYFYNYSMKISVNTPYFDDMDFSMNTFRIPDHDRNQIRRIEDIGREMTDALTGRGQGFGGYNQGMNPVHAAPPQPQQPNGGGSWVCPSCGQQNSGKFCQSCGSPRPAAPGRVIRCDKCGWTAPDPNNIPRFCPNCGDPITRDDIH